jgi:hypothetical protein
MQIYKITNLINNKIYIGKDTTSDPNYFGSGLLISRAKEKYGLSKFIKEIIDETNDYNELSVKEIYWISFYKSNDRSIGYNISIGGDGGDTLSNHPDLELIRAKISNNSKTKGKTYEEVFGVENAKIYKDKLSKSNKRILLGKTFDELYGIDDSKRIKEIISLNSKKSWTNERKQKHSENSKLNIHKSLLSEKSIENNRKYLEERWNNWKYDEENLIKKMISDNSINDLIEYTKKIPNTLFNSRKEFYEFIGKDLQKIIKFEFNKRRKPNSLNEENKVKIYIDSKEYESITYAAKVLNIQRSLIRYRLKSKNYPTYFYI